MILIWECSLAETIFFSLVSGISFFTSLLYWIAKYETRILVIVLTLSAPYFIFFALLTRFLWKRYQRNPIQIFVPPLAWLMIHFLYSFTPVNIIGNQIGFHQAPFFPGIVRITGLCGITFLILLTNSLITYYLKTKKSKLLIGLGVIALILVYGSNSKFSFFKTTPMRVALIQHNFPIDPKWRTEHADKIMDYYQQTIIKLSGTADLVAFPQYGLPVDVLRKPKVFDDLAKKLNISIILATYIPKIAGGNLESGLRTDSALLFSPGKSPQEYQAITPPPFRRISQVVGRTRKPLVIGKIRAGIMLCYEDTRSEEGRKWIQANAQILIALSNPGHFLGTNLPYYHFIHDRIRAIETGKYLIRVSPNGFSALINPNGELIKKSRLNEESVMNGVVYPNDHETLFVRWGDWMTQISVMIGLMLVIIPYIRNSINFFARKIR